MKTLERLLAPRTVAFVGASPDTSRYGGRVLDYMQKFRFGGDIWPVTPRHENIGGLRCHKSLLDLPGVPDHVGIAVSADLVEKTLQDCARLGVPFATIFTAGFGETGRPEDIARQTALVSFARKNGIGLLGPNCNGLVNWHHRFAMLGSATPVIHADKAPGSIAIVSQSGALGSSNVMLRAIQAGLGISTHVSCGNESDISMFDIVEYLVSDPQTAVILVIAERIVDGAKMQRVASLAAEHGKPILMLKLGRSEAGRRAAVSHTGSMTGSDDIHDAAFRQFGVLRVGEPKHLFQAAMLLQQNRSLQAEGVASISTSGGNVVLAADLSEKFGLSYPPYCEETRGRIAGFVPGFIQVGNPTDVSPAAIGSPDVFRGVLAALAADPGIGIVLPIMTFIPRRDVDAVVAFAQTTDKPVAMVWTGGCTDGPTRETDHMDGVVPVYRDTDTALRSIGLLVKYRRFLDRHANRASPERPRNIDVEKARRLISTSPGRVITERIAKLVIAAYGFAVPKEELVATRLEAGQALAKLDAPVVLKIESADIPHKSDAGCVRMNIRSPAEAEAAFDSIIASAEAFTPSARIEGVLVQKMAPPGLEMILGVIADPTYGPVIAAGIGGIFVEVLRDRTFRISPITLQEADGMLEELRSKALFGALSGRPKRDRAAVCDLLVRLSWLAADLADLVEEIDINPLIVHEHGAVAVDALIVRR